MSTSTATYPRSTSTWTVSTAHAAMYLVPLGRLLFAAIFLLSAPGHFKQETIQYAASAGVPAANLLVPASGILAFIGAAMVLVGWHARIGAAFLLAFLVPVTLSMHAFWSVTDATMRQMQLAMFMKNVAMMGGALLIAYFGSGPVSLDARREGQVS
jgi:putative oxidoreductase